MCYYGVSPAAQIWAFTRLGNIWCKLPALWYRITFLHIPEFQMVFKGIWYGLTFCMSRFVNFNSVHHSNILLIIYYGNSHYHKVLNAHSMSYNIFALYVVHPHLSNVTQYVPFCSLSSSPLGMSQSMCGFLNVHIGVYFILCHGMLNSQVNPLALVLKVWLVPKKNLFLCSHNVWLNTG